MSAIGKLTHALIVGAVLTVAAGWCSAAGGTTEWPSAPVLTEVSPSPVRGHPAWLELYNPLDREVSASGMDVVINDRFRYPIPSKLPAMPAKGFIVLQFDGKGAEADVYQFRDQVAFLHTPAGLTEVMTPRKGQVEIRSAGRTIGFMAWGAPASKRSLTVERNRIWRAKWFVPVTQGFGDYDPNASLQSGESVGLYPGASPTEVRNWVIYARDEASAGRANVVPRPVAFTLADGAEVRDEDVAVGWASTEYAISYQFELARDPAFTSMVTDKRLGLALYRPERGLPAGVYYYRVRTVDRFDGVSAWSKARKLVSRRMALDGGPVQEKVLTTMQHRYQRKDTQLLCLDGCASDLDGTTVKHWDNAHPDSTPSPGDHGDMNCFRASTSMMVSYYGKGLSQDRIAYHTEEEATGSGNGVPEGDLAHETGMTYSAPETEALEWALGATTTFTDTPNPTFSDLRGWLDANQPIVTRKPGHLRAMNGYRVDAQGVEWVHIMDPWSGPRWETYATWNGAAQGTWVGPVSAPNARSDEPSIWQDSDGDGVMDFDEQIRFHTGRFDQDSDNDDVGDKNDIREYVFDAADQYRLLSADHDNDGLRKEKDPDNDDDTFNDGCEDTNGNGKYEPALGETSNYAIDQGLSCTPKPVHAIIVFDRSGSMACPPNDPVQKYDRAASAATLFLDTWLLNAPAPDTKVGLVFYDHQAHFDTGATTNTTLDVFTTAKRDAVNAAFASNRPNCGTTSIGGGLLTAMGAQGFDVGTVSASGQHRVVIVLTDGMENTAPYMTSAAITQKLVEGQVDGRVLGIGNDTQIDAAKLNELADTLNGPPASLAQSMTQFQVQKFFLQALADTQGLELSVDPTGEIALGGTTSLQVPVSAGTDLVTFVAMWNEPGATVRIALKNPQGVAAAPDMTRTQSLYEIAAKSNPMPGMWTLSLSAGAVGTAPSPPKVHYDVMVLEKNDQVHSRFEIAGGPKVAGEPMLLIATLSKGGAPLVGGRVTVEVTQPRIGRGRFLARGRAWGGRTAGPAERDVEASSLAAKLTAMAAGGVMAPVNRAALILNDDGRDGDEIPGDGRYSGRFTGAKADGVYLFRFLASYPGTGEGHAVTREGTLSVLVTPRLDSSRSKVRVLSREFRREQNLTVLRLQAVPEDRFGNMLGPGYAGVLGVDAVDAKMLSIKDKLNGAYEIEVAVPGSSEKGVRLVLGGGR